MDVAEPSRMRLGPGARATLAPMIEREESSPRPYYVMFTSIDGSVPSETAVRLLNRCGGTMFRAFNGDLNASIGPNCFARDARHADFVIYLHNAICSRPPTTLPNNSRSVHWHITGLSQSSNLTEQERSVRRTESELETRIKLLVLVYEREKKKRRKVLPPSHTGTQHSGNSHEHLTA